MSAVALYAGAYHLMMYLKQRDEVKYFPFALLCFSVGLYELSCAGLYATASIEQGVVWERVRLESIPMIVVSMTWLLGIYTGRTDNTLLRSVAGVSVIYLLLSRLLPDEYTLSVDRPVTRISGFPGLFHISYIESEVGSFYIFSLALMIGLYLYLIVKLAARYQQTRDQETLYILLSQIPLFLAAANDSLVASEVYLFVYLAEYAFVFIIATMSYVMFVKLLRLHKELEESKDELEDKVRERTAQIQKLNDELQHAAEIDALTGAYNRRFLDQYLEVEMRRAMAERHHQMNAGMTEPEMNFGLAMFDIDDFKQINDKYGHINGDQVLETVAERVRASIFERDLLCRYGGEEFVVIFTRTSRQGIIEAAEKIRACVSSEPIVINDASAPMKITVSIGVTSFDDVDEPSAETILRSADECLLAAKRMGKNRVIARKIFSEDVITRSHNAATDFAI
ncbi:MAG: diguanylate cyclase [Burkholderiales bacterium]|jgi:diguanylate cyclase (GGDEF)-like protein